MCIVSFVKSNKGFILTFSRDEKLGRPSEAPKWHSFGGHSVFCPLDLEAGGTWIGYNLKIIACLQNGAKIKHKRHLPYDMSRGVILKKLLTEYSIDSLIKYIEGHKIEPFTLSIFNLNTGLLDVYRHDGLQISKESNGLETPVIICSSTLYDFNAQNEISEDFKKVNLDENLIFNFHDERRIGNVKNPFTKMVNTVSITQFLIEGNLLKAKYYDCIENQLTMVDA